MYCENMDTASLSMGKTIYNTKDEYRTSGLKVSIRPQIDSITNIINLRIDVIDLNQNKKYSSTIDLKDSEFVTIGGIDRIELEKPGKASKVRSFFFIQPVLQK